MKKILILALCGLSWHQMPAPLQAKPREPRIKNINPNEYSAFQARKKDLRMIVKEQ